MYNLNKLNDLYISKSTLTKPDTLYLLNQEKRREVKACLDGKSAILRIADCLPRPQYETYELSNLTGNAYRQAERCNMINRERANQYWARGRFFAATARTYESLGGMVWSKEPEQELEETTF